MAMVKKKKIVVRLQMAIVQYALENAIGWLIQTKPIL
jgi:hypothetical protein